MFVLCSQLDYITLTFMLSKMNLSFKDHYFMMQVIMEFNAEMHQWLQTIEQ